VGGDMKIEKVRFSYPNRDTNTYEGENKMKRGE
jgi:hypothetical protein